MQKAVTGGWDYGDGSCSAVSRGWRGRDRWFTQPVNAVLTAPLFACDTARSDATRYRIGLRDRCGWMMREAMAVSNRIAMPKTKSRHPRGQDAVTAFRTVQVPVSRKGRDNGPSASVNERLTVPWSMSDNATVAAISPILTRVGLPNSLLPIVGYIKTHCLVFVRFIGPISNSSLKYSQFCCQSFCSILCQSLHRNRICVWISAYTMPIVSKPSNIL
jgi:hypothetical protein